MQTRRHPPYGSLQPIHSPPVPFHTVTLDFVLALHLSAAGFNSLMSVTCKFSKQVTLVEGKNTWAAKDWAYTLLRRLDMIDWGLPSELITDRNLKFLSEFWKALFTKLGVKLLYSIAYHPQMDGSSKRTNQTVEIALRFFIDALEDPAKWPEVLPRIQSILNNISFSTTGKTPNEVAYGFSPRHPFDLLSALPLPQPLATRAEASNAIFFAMSNQKTTYDRKHQPLFMKVGEWAMLHLYKRYNIPAIATIMKVDSVIRRPLLHCGKDRSSGLQARRTARLADSSSLLRGPTGTCTTPGRRPFRKTLPIQSSSCIR